MKSLQISKLVELLNSANQTHIEIEDLISLYQSTSRSDFVADSITKLSSFLDTMKIKRPMFVFNEASIARHLIYDLPRVNYGRRFGNTFGLAKYVLQENKRNSTYQITIAYPSQALADNLLQALKAICTPQQFNGILSKLKIITNPKALRLCHTETDILIISDFICPKATVPWLLPIGDYIASDKKIILVGDCNSIL